MRNILTSLILLALVGSANADALFYNITGKPLKVKVILPSGATQDSNLSEGSSTAGSTSSLIFDYRIKQANYEVLDDLGTTLAKGTLDVNTTYLVAPSGDGVKVLPSGFYGGDGNIKAGYVANMTGESGTFDFVGQSGLDGQRGVALPTSFDPQKPFRYGNGEDKYEVTFTTSDGQRHTIEQKLNTNGRYWAVHRGANGKYVLSCFGNIKK